MQKDIFARTDLAYEGCATENEINGVVTKERISRGIKINDISITTAAAAKKIGRPIGQYITVLCGPLWELSQKEETAVISAISSELKKMIIRSTGSEISHGSTVLVCGLGNEEITADAVGPQTLSYLCVTRHMKEADIEIYHRIGSCSVCALRPGVLAQTGIETVELIRGAVEHVHPDAVLVIDALAARSCERLATTVQLSDTGLSPGSGIGNTRRAVNRDTLGVPVIAVGVPTVIDSSSLVYDTLLRGGISEINEELRKVLENGRQFFVSLKECDAITKKVAMILSDAINNALTVKMNIKSRR